MRQFKNVFLVALITTTSLSACQTDNSFPIPSREIDSAVNLPMFIQQLLSNRLYANCPPGVNCGGGTSR